MSILGEFAKRILIFDGGMGTMLQTRGLKAGETPELWSIDRPEDVRAIHAEYLAAGADVVSTNTFGANPEKLKHCSHNTGEIVAASVRLAKEAIALSGKKAYVALDIGPTGKLLKPLGELSLDDACALFAETIRAGAQAGADLVLIETMSDTYEVKAAVLAAKENSNLPVMASMTFDADGRLLTGGDVEAACTLLEGLGVDAIGMNCGLGPQQMAALVKEMRAATDLPILVQPNAGLPEQREGRTVFPVEPEEFAEDMFSIYQAGAWMLGGCCGTTPAHIAAVARKCAHLAPSALPEHEHTVASSYGRTVHFEKGAVMVGERINAHGAARFKQAMREHDMDFLLHAALEQQENGAQALDVNTGLPELDEAAFLNETVERIQAVCDLPLQIDTSDPVALERAARTYNGKPLVNSVNGKAESMHSVFPIVKKYGGVVLALPLDEAGIPDTAEGRLAVAKKILAVAESYGIKKRDIMLDGLAMTISAGKNSAFTALETIKRAKEELGINTALGVSNISFGLPARENINAAFLTMAIQCGLSGAIINPNLDSMKSAFYSSRALCAQDDNCVEYIERYSCQQAAKSASRGTLSLREAVVRGMKDSARAAAEQELLSRNALSVIDEILVPALNEVGEGFEQKRLFLPQLLMSAEAAESAFMAIREHMAKTGEKEVKKGKIVVATVKGDIHDIGKNIVKALLQNYGYDVIDLGRDVPLEAVLKAVKENDVTLVGLSALMTTTVVSMEETIKLLRREVPDCRIMVGGAVLTERYAESIGADHYSKDAMGSVHYAQEHFGK